MNNQEFKLLSLGNVHATNSTWAIEIKPEYRDALIALEGFSHVEILFWLHLHDTPELRKTVTCDKPYKKAPDIVGIFATRSDYRPNPIGLSVCPVKSIDIKKGIVELYYFDAENESPVIDIKPYHPGVDRVKNVTTPAWCAHWPKWYEDLADFDWAEEFNFPLS
ncbi:MAG TPA: SAM-dependent methyltransferase [Chitinispirillaceae bacterium]|nr:SAM-dependent methyltransferase [Chitinispirillaceae bacterium]